MLKRFSILILVLSFVFAGPFDMGKKAKGKFNTLPGGKGKKEKPYNKKDSELTYKDVAVELGDSKKTKQRLSSMETKAIEAFLKGEKKGGSYTKHLSNAMKKHSCYIKNSNRRVEKMKKFSKWPSLTDKVSWFALDCKTDGSSPINPKKDRKGGSSFNAGGNSKKDGSNSPN